jgi:hypothetical protein
VKRPRRRGAEPEIEVVRRRDRHLFLEPVDDLDAVVEAVRLVELLRGRGVLQAPGTVGPDVHFAHRTDRARHEDLFDLPARGRRVPLVAHLRRELRVFRGGLANEPRFPHVVRQRLLAVDVLAVRQRQIRGERVRVLGRRDDDRVEVAGRVEHAAQIGEGLRARKPLGRGVERDLVDVTEHGHVFVRMIGHGPAARCDRELAQAGERTAAAGDERDVQLVVQVPAAQDRGRARDRYGPGDEFTPCELLHARKTSMFALGACSVQWCWRTIPRCYRGFVVAVAPDGNSEILSLDDGARRAADLYPHSAALTQPYTVTIVGRRREP